MTEPAGASSPQVDPAVTLAGEKTPSVHHYFVDEAGDPALFNAKGKVIAGTEGCSRFFILGNLDVSDPQKLADALNELRQKLLADPYFAGVPSMNPEQQKTVWMFHAKDDVAEVRREVFKLLLDFDVRFYAVVRDKQTIAEKVPWTISSGRRRCFERDEHRYLDLVWPKVALILDRDDTRNADTGEYYPRKRPILAAFREDQ